MAGKQAKILSKEDIEDLLVFASLTRHPARNRVLVLLSVKAGLRAGEIGNLTWDMVLDPTGGIGAVIELRDWAAKKGSGRLIPVHPDLRAPLCDWHRLSPDSEYVICSERGGPMSAVSVVNWFALAYRSIERTRCAGIAARLLQESC